MEKKSPNRYPIHLDKELVNLYRVSEYYIFPPLDFSIYLGKENNELHKYLTKNKVQTWTFITAWNSYSQEKSLSENQEQNALLKSSLIQNNLIFHIAEGRGNGWSETSFFVENISRELAISLAKEFKQNAILFGRVEEDVELVFCK